MARNTVLASKKRKARRAIKQKQKQTVIVNIGALARPSALRGRPVARRQKQRQTTRPPVTQFSLHATRAPSLVNAGFADHYARVNAMALDDFRRGIAAASKGGAQSKGETPAQHEAGERELARAGELSRLVAEADDVRLLNRALQERAAGLEGGMGTQKIRLDQYYTQAMKRQQEAISMLEKNISSNESSARSQMNEREEYFLNALKQKDNTHEQNIKNTISKTVELMTDTLRREYSGMDDEGEEDADGEEKGESPIPVATPTTSVADMSDQDLVTERRSRRHGEAVTRLKDEDPATWSNSTIVKEARNLAIRVSGNPPNYEFLRHRIAEEIGAIKWLYE